MFRNNNKTFNTLTKHVVCKK